MTKPILLALVVRLAATITDSRGFHFRPMPVVLEAIADGVLADDVLASPEATAALVVTFIAHESGFRADVRGDGGRSCGLGQTPCSYTPLRDAPAQVRIMLRLLRQSAAASPDGLHPWATYASGSPTNAAGIRISDARSAEARALLAVVNAGGT